MTGAAPGARLIVFEGGEGCGKSTQSAIVADRLGAVLTRQPGGTTVGAALRAILLDPATSLDDRAEALLMAADRAQHAAEVIRPALDGGRHVVCDRYTYSSIAYQGHGRGLDPSVVRDISAWATDELWPDLVVLLDVEPDRAVERIDRERARDRFELVGDGFHERIRAGFLSLAADDPDRWVVVDGSGSIDEVATAVWEAVSAVVGRDR